MRRILGIPEADPFQDTARAKAAIKVGYLALASVA
jgi:hypothetical protein